MFTPCLDRAMRTGQEPASSPFPPGPASILLSHSEDAYKQSSHFTDEETKALGREINRPQLASAAEPGFKPDSM